ncbi:unnamed protein product, partial [Schistocephalus solidus]|uniref:Hydin_ADK domain-containing protein n=1 Tax=Schistocephalus solidus TaxID=70667 RepID=A0A183SPC2_SCHSO
VCSAANVQIVTLRRTEHLTEDDLRALQESHSAEGESRVSAMPGSTNPLTNLLNASEHEPTKTTTTTIVTNTRQRRLKMGMGVMTNLASNPYLHLPQNDTTEPDCTHPHKLFNVEEEAASYNPSNISIEEYFSQDANVKPKREIGRPKVMTAKLKTYKAHLYLCEEYPVSLRDQVLPIVELMAEYNPYFFKLQEFLTKQLPSGFPMKIEIPLYHILNACVTFGNLYAADAPAYGVICLSGGKQSKEASQAKLAVATQKSVEGNDKNVASEPLLAASHNSSASSNSVGAKQPPSCVVEDCVFDIGRGYLLIEENSPGHFGTIDEEEQMVQMAVQRSLQEYGGADHLIQRQYSLKPSFRQALLVIAPGTFIFLFLCPLPPLALPLSYLSAVHQVAVDSSRVISASLCVKRGVIEARPGECVDPEEAMMQTAIEQSFKEGSGLSDMEQEYLKALEISRVEVEEEEQRRRQEAEELDRILKLSLVEK